MGFGSSLRLHVHWGDMYVCPVLQTNLVGSSTVCLILPEGHMSSNFVPTVLDWCLDAKNGV
jgi:hypothetical protein